jgi:hypothetical protein
MGVYKLSANSVKNGRTIYGSMLAGNPVYEPPGDFESIATVTVGSGGSSSIEFTSIPSTYTHLQIRASVQLSGSDNWKLRINSDSGSNYAYHYLFGSGTAASAAGGASQTEIPGTYVTNSANVFAVVVLDILDYANTNKYKTTRLLTGIDTNGGGNVALYSGLWQNTNAITSLAFSKFSSGSITQYSHFALYGIKGA